MQSPAADEATTEPPILLCLAPAHQANFQQGALGQTEAKLVGELQTKKLQDSLQVSHVDIEFFGEEQITSNSSEAETSRAASDRQALELHRQRRRLWDRDSTSSNEGQQQQQLPAALPFELDLTADLPHCIHLQHSSLSYTLRATVYPVTPSLSAEPFTVAAPVHLTRYGPASFTQDFTATPCRKTLSHPFRVELSMPKSSFAKSDPVPLRVRIPPPETTLVQDKGLHLRSVSAELVRTISSTAPFSVSTILCRTGKSCRFSSARPLSLRLTLPPRLEDEVGCEAITQDTIFHSISFFVRLTVTVTGRDPSDRQDFVLNSPIGIMPDMYRTRASQKQKEAVQETLEIEYLETVPTYHESEEGNGGGIGPSTSSRRPEYIRTAATEAGWSYDSDEEPEFDGYEESAALEADAMAQPPPAISDDVSPPVLTSPAHLDSIDAATATAANSVPIARQNTGSSAECESEQPLAAAAAAQQHLSRPPSPRAHPAVANTVMLAALDNSAIDLNTGVASVLSDASSPSSNADSSGVSSDVHPAEMGESEAPPPSYRDGGGNGVHNGSLELPLMMHVQTSPATGPPPYSL